MSIVAAVRAVALPVACVAGAFTVLLVWSPPARAAGSPLSDVPAADQYRESVPTSGGPVAPREGSGRTKPLSPAAAARLRRLGGSATAKLEQVATSSALGAPQQPLPGGRDSGGEGDSVPGVPAAALGTNTGGGGSGWLAVALPVIALLALGAAGYRHFRRRHIAG